MQSINVRRQFFSYEEVSLDEPILTGESFVYFIQADVVGLVKIGCTVSPYKRFNELKNASPVRLRLLKLLRVHGKSRDVEAEFHRRFAHLRAHGEWFRPAPELAELIGATPEADPGLDRLAAAIAAR